MSIGCNLEDKSREFTGGVSLDRHFFVGFGQCREAVDQRGPGRTTAYLTECGLTVTGLDLSPQMVRLARERHPTLSFAVGSMTDLPAADGALGGLLAFYSLIHIPTPEVPQVLAEWRREQASAEAGRERPCPT